MSHVTLKIKSILLLLFILGQHTMAYDEIPILNCYEKNDYHAGRQNWAIEIDDKGVVYFGNSEGLLYNVYGEWGNATMSSPGDVRSLLAQNDTVWCGGNEYGFFTKKEGVLVFNSLGFLDGEQIWNISALNNYIIFQAENTIIHYNKENGETHSVVYDEGIWAIAEWHGKIWIALRNGQIGFLENEEFKEVLRSELFVNREIRKLFIHNDLLYIVMFEGSLYSFDGEIISRIELPGALSGKTLFTGESYDTDSYCLGTVTDGFIRLDNSGNILKWVNSEQGLIDNTVLSMERDELGNIWLGLDYGIAKLELQSAINAVFKKGATYAIKDLQGKTYLATNKGLFVSSGGNFGLMKNTGGQTWNIREIGSELFVCHNRGLFKVVNESIIPLYEYSGFLDIAHFEGTNYYLGSTYHGLILIRAIGNVFTYIENLSIWGNNKLVYDKNNQCIWAEIPDKDMFRLCLDANHSIQREEFPGIRKVFETSNGIYFSNEEALLKYEDGKFTRSDHPLLNTATGKNIKALDFNMEGNALAYIQDNEVKLEVLLPDGNVHSFSTVLRSLNNKIVTNDEFIDLDDNVMRLATDRGVTTFNINYNSRYKKFSHPAISSITVLNEGHRKYFFPYPDKGISFQKGNKDLRFHFSINKSEYDVVEYRFRLKPQEDRWTEWSSRFDEAFYPQIKGGNYELQLQSRINGGTINETSVHFTIEKLWYQTGWVAVPIILILLFWIFGVVFFMSRANRRKLKKQKQVYKEKAAQKTLLLKNEQLLQYTEIISHKNEFLNKVKTGLESMRNSEAQRWANKIADEVNNEKKEFLFHKVFSEVHQDFISRLTEKYPELTSNDIRILSFIRINLDNKEISNLMNISQRSLDTNRYRLRKKLNLSHSTDLNQFIRDF